ncbi:MAG: phosphotransferase [Solirubrobacterales bacterium]|nr:phosphotransferase [Solirubrobacterales bacterium]
MQERYVADVARLEEIVQRLEPTLGPLSGEPVALSGGITNHNYRVTLGDRDHVIRVHGADTALLGIDREAERQASEAAAALGIAPAVDAAFADCLVTRFIACSPVSPREVAGHLEEIARALRRFHDSRTRLPARFWVPEVLDDYARAVRQRGVRLPPAYAEALAVAGLIAVALAPYEPRPCHNDLLAGNIISSREDGAVLIVDWEYAGMGHPCFDLGNLSVNNDFDEAADERLLRAYYGEPPSDARRATLELMRILSDAREAAWGVLQAEISKIDFDFERYARTHFERLRAAAQQPQLEEWLAAAAA